MRKMLFILSLVVVIGAVGVVVAYACCGGVTLPPPTVTCSADPDVLWPPNHKMVDIALDIQTDGIVVSVIATSDEPDDAPGGGDGKTTGDIIQLADGGLSLRAERAGSGDGRTYTITVVVQGDGVNTDPIFVTSTCEVTVPHDMGE